MFKQQQQRRWHHHFNLNESQKHHFVIRDHAFLLTVNGCNYFQVHIEIVCHCSCLLLKHLTSALFSIFMHFISNSTVSILLLFTSGCCVVIYFDVGKKCNNPMLWQPLFYACKHIDMEFRPQKHRCYDFNGQHRITTNLLANEWSL